jgi:hypothetical protein
LLAKKVIRLKRSKPSRMAPSTSAFSFPRRKKLSQLIFTQNCSYFYNKARQSHQKAGRQQQRIVTVRLGAYTWGPSATSSSSSPSSPFPPLTSPSSRFLGLYRQTRLVGLWCGTTLPMASVPPQPQKASALSINKAVKHRNRSTTQHLTHSHLPLTPFIGAAGCGGGEDTLRLDPDGPATPSPSSSWLLPRRFFPNITGVMTGVIYILP